MPRPAPQTDVRPVARLVALPDLAATAALGRALAGALGRGDVVALAGELGAGKTELARAVLRAATGDPELAVPSPTFTLVETYDTPRGTVWHFDLYRLASADEAFEIGFEEALGTAASLVEWPERLGAALPRERLDVRLDQPGPGEARRARLVGHGRWASRLANLDLPAASGAAADAR